MNPAEPLPPDDDAHEIAALIATLHDTEQRLELLTAGEIDTVAHADGRTLLLRRSQEHLRHSEAAKQAAILNALPAHIALLDTRGVIVSVNDAWRKFTGADAAHCPGPELETNYLELCDAAGPDPLLIPHQAAAGIRTVLGGTAQGFTLEYACHSAAQRRWLLLTVTPLDPDRPRGVVVMHADVTARREATDHITLLNDTLEQRVAQRTFQLQTANEELRAFSHSVSHDLRAPVRHVLAFAEILTLEAGPTLSPENLQHLSTITRAARRMGNLIDDLLAFSRIGQADMQMSDLDLDELVHDSVTDSNVEQTGREIHWNIQPLPTVRANRALLRMVLVNLISNAVKFTGKRAVAKIEIGCRDTGGGETVIFIRDNGAGFDSRYAGKLFNVFERLHPESDFEGTGIGLANVKRIIARHGGEVWADGVVDGSATFYFSLKNHSAAGEDEAAAVQQVAAVGAVCGDVAILE